MSRGKPSVGAAIACRLPTEADKRFREKAKERGLTPGQMAKGILQAAIDAA